MDFDSFFRNKIESLLITASWVEQVQKMLGLGRVSQVWRDRPEWYLWIDGAPGVYALIFENGMNLDSAGRSLVLGQFVLKCFPAVGGDVFDALSPQEQELRVSNRFDETGTPRLEVKDNIPGAYFTVGSISLMFNAAGTAAAFSFDSLDVLRWARVNAATGRPALDGQIREKDVIRSLPAWRTGYPLFDCLVGLYAFNARQSPVYCGATQSSGFECILYPDHALESRPCDDARQWSASVLFNAPADADEVAQYLWRVHLDSTETIVFEQQLGHAAGHPGKSTGAPYFTVNPLWWKLAHADLKSSLTSTCGCCAHEHHT